mgnify:CR=1 FL=1
MNKKVIAGILCTVIVVAGGAVVIVNRKAAAKYIQENGESCKLTGLGLPSEMLDYTGDDGEHACPYFYLWDTEDGGNEIVLGEPLQFNAENIEEYAKLY